MANLINDMIRTNRRNAIKVSEQPSEIKGLLTKAVTYSKADDTPKKVNSGIHLSQKQEIAADIIGSVYTEQTRCNLLRTAIICGTTVNDEAKSILIRTISSRLGTITEKDYDYIANILNRCKDTDLVVRVNTFLCQNLKGFEKLHMYNYAYYYL